MQTFFEWKNTNIKMSFGEKYNMLIQRLSSLQGMKMAADAAQKTGSRVAIMGLGCCGAEDKTVDEIVREVDLMWAEIKEEIKSSVKDKDKKDEQNR
jgi:hypothetical protein